MLTLAALAFASTSFSQTKDSMLSEMLINGVWQKYTLDITMRDADCNATSQLELAWNESTQSWVNSYLSVYKIDNTTDNIETVQQGWDATNNAWVNYSRSALLNSSNGKKRTYTFEFWDAGSNTYVGSYRLIDDHDSTGRTVVTEFDNFSNGEWQKVQRGLLHYDENGYVNDNIFQVWTNNAWVNNGRTISSYSGKGETIEYYWDIGNQSWIKTSRTFNNYIKGTNAKKSLGQILSGTEWQNNFRSESNYNDDNLMYSNFQQTWDANSSVWINSSKASYDYYPNKSPHHFKFEAWDPSSNTWVYGFRTSSPDINCLQSLQVVPVVATKNTTGLSVQNKSDHYFLHSMPQAKTSNNIQKIFNPLASDARHTVYDLTMNRNGKQYAYELILTTAVQSKTMNSKTTGNAVVSAKAFTISPNPAKNYFNINLPAYKNAGDIILKISDMSGKVVMQKTTGAGMQRIDIASLQKGIYIVSIISGKEMQTAKLVVQ